MYLLGMCVSLFYKIFQFLTCCNHPPAWGIGILKTHPTGHTQLIKCANLIFLFLLPNIEWCVSLTPLEDPAKSMVDRAEFQHDPLLFPIVFYQHVTLRRVHMCCHAIGGRTGRY